MKRTTRTPCLLLGAVALAPLSGAFAQPTFPSQPTISNPVLSTRTLEPDNNTQVQNAQKRTTDDLVLDQKKAEKALAEAKTPQQKAAAQIELGLNYSQRKLYEPARKQWSQVIETEGVPPDLKLEAHTLMGGSYSEESQWSLARAQFQKALAFPEGSTSQKAALGWALAATFFNDKQRAAGYKELRSIVANTAVETNFRATVASQLGQELISDGQFEAARDAFNQILSFPAVPAALRIVAQAGIAQSFKAQGDEAKAQAAFSLARTEALKGMAIYAKAKRYESARALAVQALSLGTVPPVLTAVLQNQIGQFLLQEGQPEQARIALEAYLEQPDAQNFSAEEETKFLAIRHSTYLTLSKVYLAQGNKEQAKQVIQKLLAMDNVNPLLKVAATQHLQNLQ